MKRFLGSKTLVVLGFAVAAAAAADQNGPGHGPHGAMAGGLHHMQKCLSTLDLPAATSANIENAMNAGKATLRADGQALGAAHKQMEADLAAGADKSVLGQDAINQDAAKNTLKTDAEAIRAQVLGQLSAGELEQYNACAAAAKTGHGRPAPPPDSQN